MQKISNKAFKELTCLISNVINLNKVEEFGDTGELFENIPEWWTDEEKSICDYQGRIINELVAGIKKIFGKEDADAKN
jgi:hypothetical protein